MDLTIIRLVIAISKILKIESKSQPANYIYLADYW